MQGIIRLLLVIVVGELAYVGYLTARQLGHYEPVMPNVVFDDPLVPGELRSLADTARGGDSQDWQRFGEGLLGQGFYGEAELAFRRAVQLDANNGLAQFSLANCIDRTGRIEESNREYQRAAEIAVQTETPVGSRDHCLYQLARNSLRAEQPKQAEKLFKEIISFFPAAYQYAKLQVRSGRAAEAMDTIDHFLKIHPQSLKFTSLKLHALEALNRPLEATEAAHQLERSESVVPIDFGSTFVKPFYERLGNQREQAICEQLWINESLDALAKKLNELLVVMEPTSHFQKYLIRKSLIKVEYHRKNADRILELIELAQADGSNDSDLLQMKGAAYAIKGDMDRAAELWQRAAFVSPNIPLHHSLAEYFDNQGDAASRDEQLGLAALLQTKIDYWSNQFEAAQQAVNRAKKLLPESATVWYYAAEIERAMGNLDQARTDYARCVQLDPSHGRAVRALKTLASP